MPHAFKICYWCSAGVTAETFELNILCVTPSEREVIIK